MQREHDGVQYFSTEPSARTASFSSTKEESFSPSWLTASTTPSFTGPVMLSSNAHSSSWRYVVRAYMNWSCTAGGTSSRSSLIVICEDRSHQEVCEPLSVSVTGPREAQLHQVLDEVMTKVRGSSRCSWSCVWCDAKMLKAETMILLCLQFWLEFSPPAYQQRWGPPA